MIDGTPCAADDAPPRCSVPVGGHGRRVHRRNHAQTTVTPASALPVTADFADGDDDADADGRRRRSCRRGRHRGRRVLEGYEPQRVCRVFGGRAGAAVDRRCWGVVVAGHAQPGDVRAGRGSDGPPLAGAVALHRARRGRQRRRRGNRHRHWLHRRADHRPAGGPARGPHRHRRGHRRHGHRTSGPAREPVPATPGPTPARAGGTGTGGDTGTEPAAPTAAPGRTRHGTGTGTGTELAAPAARATGPRRSSRCTSPAGVAPGPGVGPARPLQ